MTKRLALAIAIATPIALLDIGMVRADTPPSAATSTTGNTSGTGTYKVKSGDGLAAIARKLGVKLTDLLAVNNITITSTIHPGQTLKVPASSGGQTSSTTGSGSTGSGSTSSTQINTGATNAYTVKSGDSLFGIARKHGVSLNSLLAANSFALSSTILPGQAIKVPTAPSTTQSATPSTAASAPTANSSTPAASPIDTLTGYLREQVGKPYKFFTAGPDTFDCSGLVVAAFRQIGMSVPHQSRALARLGNAVDWRSEPISAGDLVFTSALGDPELITHVGIALDSRRWVHAVGFGRTVSISTLPSTDRIMAVQRIALP